MSHAFQPKRIPAGWATKVPSCRRPRNEVHPHATSWLQSQPVDLLRTQRSTAIFSLPMRSKQHLHVHVHVHVHVHAPGMGCNTADV